VRIADLPPNYQLTPGDVVINDQGVFAYVADGVFDPYDLEPEEGFDNGLFLLNPDGTFVQMPTEGVVQIQPFEFSINTKNHVLFRGLESFDPSTQHFPYSLFLETADGPERVIGAGDYLFGKEVHEVRAAYNALNNNDQIAFYAVFADGSFGIYRADPSLVPEPGSIVLVGFGLAAFTRRRRSAARPALRSDDAEQPGVGEFGFSGVC
jgi:hypothetical protein